MDRRFPGLYFWESTWPWLFFAVACTLLTFPRRQRPTASASFAAASFSPLIFGTTHASSALSVRVAVGVELVAHEPASATWKTYAAPVCNLTPGAPASAVAPSPESAPMPKLSPAWAPAMVRVAAGVEVEAQSVSPDTWKT